MGYLEIIFLLISTQNGLASYQGACRSNNFELLAGESKADAFVIATAIVQLFSVCAQLCLAEQQCSSFNYHIVRGTCELLEYNHFESDQKRLVSSEGWEFHQKVPNNKAAETKVCKEWQKIVGCGTLGISCHNLANIALGKPTNQSSTCYNGTPERAVDGNVDTIYGTYPYTTGSCTHTCTNSSPWWMVNFGQTALVHAVNVTNRGDCCGIRLSDFNIRIGESESGPRDGNAACITNASVATGATKLFRCTLILKGRYLYIESNLNTELTLCEVKVFGEFI